MDMSYSNRHHCHYHPHRPPLLHIPGSSPVDFPEVILTGSALGKLQQARGLGDDLEKGFDDSCEWALCSMMMPDSMIDEMAGSRNGRNADQGSRARRKHLDVLDQVVAFA